MKDISNLIYCCKKLKASGFLSGTAGNLSIRDKNNPSFFLITPSGIDYDELIEDSIVKVCITTGECSGSLKPSIEKDLHRLIYLNYPEINAVVHTHSPFCTAMACANKTIPFFNVESVAIGEVPLIPYECPGSIELAQITADMIKNKKCALMANHGMISIGNTIHEALDLSFKLEGCCKSYILASSVGTIIPFTQVQIEKALSMLKSYGQ